MRYNYHVRLVGGPADGRSVTRGNVKNELWIPTTVEEKSADIVEIRSLSGLDYFPRKKYKDWSSVNFAVYQKDDRQQRSDQWRYIYRGGIIVYRCTAITKNGKRCNNFSGQAGGKCITHAKDTDQ